MTDFSKRIVHLIAMLVLIFVASAARAELRNVIVFIGDGMGPEQVKAAGLYAFGENYPENEKLSFEKMPYQGFVTTHSANNAVTDSAAAATAMATGHKVDSTVISQQFWPDVHWKERGKPLETILEYYQKQGKKTGLVTTTVMTHATPAAFAAHEPTRYNYEDIGHDMLTQVKPLVLFGGGGSGVTPEKAEGEGYLVVTDRAGLQAIDTTQLVQVSGQFGKGNMPYEFDEDFSELPHLREMVKSAIEILANSEQGFFLMVEGGKIDHAGHSNELQRNIYETLEFADAVQVAIEFAAVREDTLVIVTADHETGGLTVVKGRGVGQFPEVTWSTKGHTATNVPVAAMGPGADKVVGVIDNTDIYRLAKGAMVEEAVEQTADKGME